MWSPANSGGILIWRCPSFRLSVRHFCVRNHILEVLWQISLKLGMSIYMDKRMMHAKWHCTPSDNNGVMALCIFKKAVFCVSEAISWKCFDWFYCNFVWVSRIILSGNINSTYLLVNKKLNQWNWFLGIWVCIFIPIELHIILIIAIINLY